MDFADIPVAFVDSSLGAAGAGAGDVEMQAVPGGRGEKADAAGGGGGGGGGHTDAEKDAPPVEDSRAEVVITILDAEAGDAVVAPSYYSTMDTRIQIVEKQNVELRNRLEMSLREIRSMGTVHVASREVEVSATDDDSSSRQNLVHASAIDIRFQALESRNIELEQCNLSHQSRYMELESRLNEMGIKESQYFSEMAIKESRYLELENRLIAIEMNRGNHPTASGLNEDRSESNV